MLSKDTLVLVDLLALYVLSGIYLNVCGHRFTLC